MLTHDLEFLAVQKSIGMEWNSVAWAHAFFAWRQQLMIKSSIKKDDLGESY